MPANIDISNEREGPTGWSFDVHVIPADGPAQRCTLKLSFADYNHWSMSGTDAPASVARAVVAFMLENLRDEALPVTFDAALARRRFAQADEVIPTLIRG